MDHGLNEEKKQGNQGDRRKIPVTWQFFEASSRHEDFFGKTKKPVLGLGQCEYVCKISGLYCFSFGQETWHK